MIDPEAYRRAVFAADVKEGDEAVMQLAQLGGILGVGIVYMLERPAGIDIVARIDAHLLGIAGRDIGYRRIEVDIRHERGHHTLGAEACIDVSEVFSLADVTCGQTHIFATCGDDALGLLYAGFGVLGRNVGHRLQADGIFPAEGRGTDIDCRRCTAPVIEQVDHLAVFGV